jgi:hypothetical protein
MVDIYYRSYHIVDNKPKWVITNEDGNIIRNPTKEQRKLAVLDKKNKLKGRICI